MMRYVFLIWSILIPFIGNSQSITGLNIIDANTNTVIGSLTDSFEIDLSSTSNFSIEAITNPAMVGSVVFTLSGTATHNQTESMAPYALFGDNSGDFNPWTNPATGVYTLTATPYDQSGGTGTPGVPWTVTFFITNGGGGGSSQGGVSDTVRITGQLKKWHKVTLTFDGVNTCENDAINPFTEYRLMVTFTNGPKTYVVPGFYAADGDAGNTSATCGNKWRVYFTPDETGTWNYSVSYRTGNNIAISDDPNYGTPVDTLDGLTGTFTIMPTDKSGKDFRAKGMLKYVGEHYLQFSETGEYYIKGGADSPENLLGYDEFDQTVDQGGTSTPGLVNGLHQYAPHVQDWKPGDPTWKGGKGKGLIGALNYLASQGGNSVYFLTYNIDGGDGRDTWVWNDVNERYRFDVSKLAQWEIVFSHMDSLGIQMHVITQETENDNSLGGNGQLNDIRKLYFRELVARFSHHLAIQWNLGEENTNSDAEKASFAQYIRELDPYDHPINVHTQYGNATSFYSGLINNASYRQYFEATSIQGNATSYNEWAVDLRNASESAGKKWIIYGDEQGPAVDANINNLGTLRKEALWGNLMGGGGGVEWYFGYQGTFGDVQSEDWRVAEDLWQQTKYALDFFQDYLPFAEMESNNSLLSAGSSDYCFAKEGEIYALYLKYGGGGGTINLNLNTPGIYTVKWYNPRTGGALQDGSITTVDVTSHGNYAIGAPLVSGSNDWVALVTNNSFMNSTVTEIDVTCHGDNDGSIDINVSGGYPPYNYIWSNGETTSSINSLLAGTYSVTVTDSVGSNHSKTVVISEPAAIDISGSVTDESAQGSDGEIQLTVTGGIAPFHYAWSNGANVKDITGLSAGAYQVTATDANGCSTTGSFQVHGAPLYVTISSTDVTCHGSSDGSASLDISGGSPPYSYLWSNGNTSLNANNLTAGTYSVTVSDDFGTSVTKNVIINQPAAINISSNVVDEGPLGNNGEIQLTVSGGTSPYNFLWSSGSTSEDLTGLSADNYEVTVTDANGCSASEAFQVDNAPFNLSVSSVDVTCNGSSDGYIDLNVSGGSPPYTYLWSNGDTAASLTDLQAGSYRVTITDDIGTTTANSVTITEPDSIAITGIISDEGIEGGNGQIELTVTGGTPPYSFSWSQGETTKNINGLDKGVYHVTVTDAAGCNASASFEVEKDPVSGIEPASGIKEVIVYPNPFVNSFSVDLRMNKIKPVSFFVYDLNGKIIQSHEFNGSTEIQQQFDLHDFASGVYLLTIVAGEEKVVRKLVKY